MDTVDLNIGQQWDELFRRVEAGEILRVVRGKEEVAFVEPARVVAEDQAFLDMLADMGARQIAGAFPPNEYAEWDKPEKVDGTR